MSHTGRLNWRKVILGFLLSSVLAACGGSGGSSDFGSGGGTDPGAPIDINISLVLTDVDGVVTSSVTAVDPGVLEIFVTDISEQPLVGELVTITTTIGVLDPEAGTALTDSDGIASILILADGELGAGTFTASVSNGVTAFTAELNFQVGEADLVLGRLDEDNLFVEGEIEASSTSLPAAGSAQLTVAVVDGSGELVDSAVVVNFVSACAGLTPPTAELTASTTAVNGIASGTYTATGCTGNDTVTASLEGTGTSTTATVVLSVASAAVNSIVFESAEPTTLALKGTGGEGRSESSIVQFKVLDATGAPVQGELVDFSLSTEIGGVSLSTDSAITNDEGLARAIVLAGNVSTAVRVSAAIEVDGDLLTTVSDRLVVSTGLPDQDSFSLSVTVFNPGGGDTDGVTSTFTIRMADKFNNPVPDGTTAIFTTELGAINSACETVDGACSGVWESQAPKLPLFNQDLVTTIFNTTCPTNGEIGSPCPDSLGEMVGRRSTVLVTAIGEESFDDENGNGLWDIGEDHVDLPEAFVDHNENGVFDGDSNCTPGDSESGRSCASGLEETFVDFNDNGEYDDGNGIYNGTLCPQDLADLEECSRELISVRNSISLVMSNTLTGAIYHILTDTSDQELSLSELDNIDSTLNFRVYFSDEYNSVPANGTAISVDSDSCDVASVSKEVVDNTSQENAFRISVTIQPDPDNEETTEGSLFVKVPGVEWVYSCSDKADPAPDPDP